jgi:hypothetical protein
MDEWVVEPFGNVCVLQEGGRGFHCRGLLALALENVLVVSLLSIHEFALIF